MVTYPISCLVTIAQVRLISFTSISLLLVYMPNMNLAQNRSENVEEELLPVKLNHPYKVKKILRGSKDVIQFGDSVQILIEAWDDVPSTYTISKDVSLKLSEGDVILIEWEGPIARGITKILKGEEADEVWEPYKKYYNEVIKPQREHQKQQPLNTTYIR
jgi:hypothetical protein